eukprot:jgi/Mesvir1/326/Mv22734-RA.1
MQCFRLAQGLGLELEFMAEGGRVPAYPLAVNMGRDNFATSQSVWEQLVLSCVLGSGSWKSMRQLEQMLRDMLQAYATKTLHDLEYTPDDFGEMVGVLLRICFHELYRRVPMFQNGMAHLLEELKQALAVSQDAIKTMGKQLATCERQLAAAQRLLMSGTSFDGSCPSCGTHPDDPQVLALEHSPQSSAQRQTHPWDAQVDTHQPAKHAGGARDVATEGQGRGWVAEPPGGEPGRHSSGGDDAREPGSPVTSAGAGQSFYRRSVNLPLGASRSPTKGDESLDPDKGKHRWSVAEGMGASAPHGPDGARGRGQRSSLGPQQLLGWGNGGRAGGEDGAGSAMSPTDKEGRADLEPEISGRGAGDAAMRPSEPALPKQASSKRSFWQPVDAERPGPASREERAALLMGTVVTTWGGSTEADASRMANGADRGADAGPTKEADASDEATNAEKGRRSSESRQGSTPSVPGSLTPHDAWSKPSTAANMAAVAIEALLGGGSPRRPSVSFASSGRSSLSYAGRGGAAQRDGAGSAELALRVQTLETKLKEESDAAFEAQRVLKRQLRQEAEARDAIERMRDELMRREETRTLELEDWKKAAEKEVRAARMEAAREMKEQLEAQRKEEATKWETKLQLMLEKEARSRGAKVPPPASSGASGGGREGELEALREALREQETALASLRESMRADAQKLEAERKRAQLEVVDKELEMDAKSQQLMALRLENAERSHELAVARDDLARAQAALARDRADLEMRLKEVAVQEEMVAAAAAGAGIGEPRTIVVEKIVFVREDATAGGMAGGRVTGGSSHGAAVTTAPGAIAGSAVSAAVKTTAAAAGATAAATPAAQPVDQRAAAQRAGGATSGSVAVQSSAPASSPAAAGTVPSSGAAGSDVADQRADQRRASTRALAATTPDGAGGGAGKPGAGVAAASSSGGRVEDASAAGNKRVVGGGGSAGGNTSDSHVAAAQDLCSSPKEGSVQGAVCAPSTAPVDSPSAAWAPASAAQEPQPGSAASGVAVDGAPSAGAHPDSAQARAGDAGEGFTRSPTSSQGAIYPGAPEGAGTMVGGSGSDAGLPHGGQRLSPAQQAMSLQGGLEGIATEVQWEGASQPSGPEGEDVVVHLSMASVLEEALRAKNEALAELAKERARSASAARQMELQKKGAALLETRHAQALAEKDAALREAAAAMGMMQSQPQPVVPVVRGGSFSDEGRRAAERASATGGDAGAAIDASTGVGGGKVAVWDGAAQGYGATATAIVGGGSTAIAGGIASGVNPGGWAGRFPGAAYVLCAPDGTFCGEYCRGRTEAVAAELGDVRQSYRRLSEQYKALLDEVEALKSEMWSGGGMLGVGGGSPRRGSRRNSEDDGWDGMGPRRLSNAEETVGLKDEANKSLGKASVGGAKREGSRAATRMSKSQGPGTRGNQVLPPNVHGYLEFDAPTYSCDEGDGFVAVTVIRSGGSTGRVTIQFSTLDGSAMADVDYVPITNRELVWEDGDEGPKVVCVEIVDDTFYEPDETFSVVLSKPRGGVGLGDQSTAEVLIIDDDPAPLPPPGRGKKGNRASVNSRKGSGGKDVTAAAARKAQGDGDAEDEEAAEVVDDDWELGLGKQPRPFQVYTRGEGVDLFNDTVDPCQEDNRKKKLDVPTCWQRFLGEKGVATMLHKSNTRTLPVKQLRGLLGQIFRAKLQADEVDFKCNSALCPLADFVRDHILHQVGLHGLAMNKLGHIISSLKYFFRQGKEYRICFFARVCGMYSALPPSALVLYLRLLRVLSFHCASARNQPKLFWTQFAGGDAMAMSWTDVEATVCQLLEAQGGGLIQLALQKIKEDVRSGVLGSVMAFGTRRVEPLARGGGGGGSAASSLPGTTLAMSLPASAPSPLDPPVDLNTCMIPCDRFLLGLVEHLMRVSRENTRALAAQFQQVAAAAEEEGEEAGGIDKQGFMQVLEDLPSIEVNKATIDLMFQEALAMGTLPGHAPVDVCVRALEYFTLYLGEPVTSPEDFLARGAPV